MKTSACRSLGFALCGFLLMMGAQAKSQPPREKPNIVYIVADDLGWKDVGFHGSDIRTPNLDKLAETGVQFQQFYAQPMCTPTRAALMTGRYPFRYGLQTGVIPSSYTYGLSTEEWLLPQALKEAGYYTAIVGKWHLGHANPKYRPRQRGFDYQYGMLIGEIDYFTHQQHGVLDWYRNNQPVKEEGYSTILLGNDAVKLITTHDPAVPLYLYLCSMLRMRPIRLRRNIWIGIRTFPDPSRRAYAAMITAMDDQIGRVVKALGDKGIRENTLIIFQSDNGGTRNKMFAGEGDMTKITIPCDNGPYREGKGSLYEGGTRVPAFANWPGHIPAGNIVEGMVHVVDMYPTLADLGGAQLTRNKALDGIDMWPTISEGKSSPHTELVYNIEPFRAGGPLNFDSALFTYALTTEW